MTAEYWISRLNQVYLSSNVIEKTDALPLMVEFSSPNTNKPLHLGHIRNNLLGDSVSRILAAAGNNVIKLI
jgi:arginyl-tRNA synthetase